MGKNKKIISVLMVIACISMTLLNENQIYPRKNIYAETDGNQNVTVDSHWYTQKNWTYNEKKLTSMCYITSYAMVLSNMGIEANPIDVYVANGCSNYVVHSKIAKAYGVDTSETGTIIGTTEKEKADFVKNLIEKYPQGVIVGGSYGSGTHYIVAKKVENGEIYFDDPAFATEEEGCCIPISKIYKHTWNTLTKYRVVKYEKGLEVTASPDTNADEKIEETVVTASAIPMASIHPTVEPTKNSSPKPTTVATVTPSAVIATPECTKEVDATPTLYPISTSGSSITQEGTANPTAFPASTPEVTIEPTVIPTPVPTAYNPLGKYQVPTRTIYYQKTIMKGEDVKWVEYALKTLGYKISVDGEYSKKDKTIAIKYQEKKGLSPDGYVGENTRKQIIMDLEIALTKVKKVNGVKIEKSDISKNSVSQKSLYEAFVSWKHIEDVDGYVLLYSTNKKFSKKKRVSISKNNAKIDGLKKDKKYYIKIRAYKKVNGKKVYGTFSKIKKCKW